jgi:hypothetical protein
MGKRRLLRFSARTTCGPGKTKAPAAQPASASKANALRRHRQHASACEPPRRRARSSQRQERPGRRVWRNDASLRARVLHLHSGRPQKQRCGNGKRPVDNRSAPCGNAHDKASRERKLRSGAVVIRVECLMELNALYDGLAGWNAKRRRGHQQSRSRYLCRHKRLRWGRENSHLLLANAPEPLLEEFDELLLRESRVVHREFELFAARLGHRKPNGVRVAQLLDTTGRNRLVVEATAMTARRPLFNQHGIVVIENATALSRVSQQGIARRHERVDSVARGACTPGEQKGRTALKKMDALHPICSFRVARHA